MLARLWLSTNVFLSGGKDRSRELFDRCMALGRHQGDPWLLVVLLTSVHEYFPEGEIDKARSTLLEAESVLRMVGDQWGLASAVNALGRIELARGNLVTARDYIAEGLRLAREYGAMFVQVFSLVATGDIIARRAPEQSVDENIGELELATAARLCGAAQSAVDDRCIRRAVGTRETFDSMTARVRSALKADTWDRGFEEGRSIPFEQALGMAEAELARILF